MKKRKGTSRAKRGRRKEIKSRREKLLQSLCHVSIITKIVPIFDNFYLLFPIFIVDSVNLWHQ